MMICTSGQDVHKDVPAAQSKHSKAGGQVDLIGGPAVEMQH